MPKNRILARTQTKFEDGVVNEDAVKASPYVIAVSDGAGGGGVYADRWSAYLLEHLPETPLRDFTAFDTWIEGIWEDFYKQYEAVAKQTGGMLLDKFYDEGSFATLVAVWKTQEHRYFWMSYGDSVAFHYRPSTGKLEHSFGRIVDFKNPPYLINYIAPLQEEGYRCGEFEAEDDSVVFVASDTLAQYILIMYQVANREEFKSELAEVMQSHTRYGSLVQSALAIKKVYFKDKVLMKLIHAAEDEKTFRKHLESRKKQGLLGLDDYSIAWFLDSSSVR